MALTSFMRDFGLDLVEKTQRDTIQGNIVSTFQVHLFSSLHMWCSSDTLLGWLFLRCPVHIPHC